MKKTIFLIAVMLVTVQLFAQDTIRYVGGVPQYDYLKLTKKIDAINNNLDMYAAQRRQAVYWLGGSVITSMAVTGYNVSEEPVTVLYVIPAAMSIVSIVKLIGAEKYLRRIEVTGSSIKIRF